LAIVRLRDRDAIVTREGLIFRVFGYTHPSDAYICDLEYAPSEIFKSNNPKAPRGTERRRFYKFYEDEGWNLLREKHSEYLFFHKMLQQTTIAVLLNNIKEVRRPDETLQALLGRRRKDALVTATQTVLETVAQHSGLTSKDFGVFGSMLHNMHHPKMSDIDLVVYGRSKTAKLAETLEELYRTRSSPLQNEFETDQPIKNKRWRFINLTPQEFVWHQKRKKIYAVFKDRENRRKIKTEFEPVKDWTEMSSEYEADTRVSQKGWTRMSARVTDDKDAPFIPSVYGIQPLQVLQGRKEAKQATRIVSYLEEFRMQAGKGEEIYLEGNLEQITSAKKTQFQVTLTHCPRYYQQVIKITKK
jgi:predicted nucleotidyltransferase